MCAVPRRCGLGIGGLTTHGDELEDAVGHEGQKQHVEDARHTAEAAAEEQRPEKPASEHAAEEAAHAAEETAARLLCHAGLLCCTGILLVDALLGGRLLALHLRRLLGRGRERALHGRPAAERPSAAHALGIGEGGHAENQCRTERGNEEGFAEVCHGSWGYRASAHPRGLQWRTPRFRNSCRNSCLSMGLGTYDVAPPL